MAELIALLESSGAGFVERLQRIWDEGNACLPVDLRLPAAARAALLSRMRPAAIIDEGQRTDLRHSVPVEAGDALVMSTSGTTGAAKGVVLTHDAVSAAAWATSAAVDADPTQDTWLCCLPTAHMGGLGVVTRALITGTPLVIHDRFDADAVDRAAADGSTLVSLVATAMRRIDTAGFRTIVLGGGPVPPDKPDNAVATYGLTETHGGVVYGRVPIDGVSMRIADGSGAATSGEIELSGPMLMRCYRHDGEGAVASTGVDPLQDGWLATGDLGSIDTEGNLSVSGRKGDLIISGGENVWPAPVEAVLAQHPMVDAVAVVGRHDPEWGQAVVAIVEPVDSAQVPTLDDLRSLVKEHLPVFCAPRRLEIAALPRTALGKVVRTDL